MTITPIEYRGWSKALRLSNGLVEAVVVPAIGRVMQFHRVGGENVLWEDESLDGLRSGVDAEGWSNFGGDKIWPSPQAGWETFTGRPWPPPEAFDSRPYEAELQGEQLLLRSPVDNHYGIQTLRRIQLLPGQPVMGISTEFRKLSGEPVRAGIWVITQTRDPERVFVLLPENPRMPSGFVSQMGPVPGDLSLQGRLLSLSRDPAEKIKIGTEGLSLLWVGPEDLLRIDAPELPGEYPDDGSRTEVYTNSDPLPYVELETLGPLATLACGDVIEWTNTYTLLPRSKAQPEREAKKVFGLHAGSESRIDM